MLVAADSPRLKELTPRPEWQPGAKDHLVYHWVKFSGMRQSSAAQHLGISQPTVSRIVERYERWQAHASEREGGRLDSTERRRAQKWLTYERNELILASALRIAEEMEGFVDVSKSVIRRPLAQVDQEHEVRTEHSTVDRHSIAARFLRLAHRINMDQLKLVEQDPAPLPEPLSAEELAEEQRLDALVAADFAKAEQGSAEEAAQRAREFVITGRPAAAAASPSYEPEAAPQPEDAAQPEETIIHAVNNLNKAVSESNAVTQDVPCTCATNGAEEENSQPVFKEPQPPESLQHDSLQQDSLPHDPWVDPVLNSRLETTEDWMAEAAAYLPCPSSAAGTDCGWNHPPRHSGTRFGSG